MFQVKVQLLVLFVCAFAFAENTTRWQSTRNGSESGNCRLEVNKINVVIHPFHLDVEEEATLMAEGSVSWGDPKTLEIRGDFTLTPGTAIRSMLLWNGTQVLKAKLKDRFAADSAYEQVVNRVVVRDPAIIEQIGENRYRIRIYPVAINQSRRVRILYSVPLQAFSDGPAFEINTIFTAGPDSRPEQIPIVLIKGETPIRQFLIHYGNVRKAAQFGVTYLIPSASLFAQPYYWYNSREASKFYIIPDSTSRNRAYSCNVSAGPAAGNYMAVFAEAPDSVKTFIRSMELPYYQLEARITAGSRSFIADIPSQGCIGVYLKSTAAWDYSIHWTVYGSNGWVIYKHRQIMAPETSSAMTSLLPLFWGAKYSLDEGNGNLGALYGFVDSKMSLLALESDSMPRSAAVLYENGGVPVLTSREIVLDAAQMPVAPADESIFEIQNTASETETAVADATLANKIQLLPNGCIHLTLKNRELRTAVVSVFDIRGRLVTRMELNSIRNGSAQFKLPAGLRGRYVVRVKAGNDVITSKIVLM